MIIEILKTLLYTYITGYFMWLATEWLESL